MRNVYIYKRASREQSHVWQASQLVGGAHNLSYVLPSSSLTPTLKLDFF